MGHSQIKRILIFLSESKMTRRYRITIDDVPYTAEFRESEYKGLPMLVLGPDDSSCLEIIFRPESVVIHKVDASGICNLPLHGVLDLLVPLAIEISLEFINRSGIFGLIPENYFTRGVKVGLADVARLPNIPEDATSLSLLKILTGARSTTYSKYGFFPGNLNQEEISRQSEFFLSHTGYSTPGDFQRWLVSQGISLNETLSQITSELYTKGYYEQITQLYKVFFPMPGLYQVLDIPTWNLYKQQHRVHLEIVTHN
jgi:hypothetical protein